MKTVIKSITFTEKPIRVMIEKWLCKMSKRFSTRAGSQRPDWSRLMVGETVLLQAVYRFALDLLESLLLVNSSALAVETVHVIKMHLPQR